MKISCANCRKRYNINEARLPSGAKAAKCGACGHLISLERAHSSHPADETQVIKISCQYCGKNYALRKNKIPSNATAFRCKSCRHLVSLKQKMDQAPVAPIIKKGSSPIPSEKPPIKASERDLPQTNFIRITCPSCRQRYKISQNSIPPDAIALNCRNCEYKISLTPPPAIKASENRDPIEDHTLEKAPPKLKTIPKDVPRRVDRPRKRRWLIAAAAVVLLVGII